jgi:hypothetical protein
MNELCAMGTMQQVHVDASGNLWYVCLLCMLWYAWQGASHVGWRLTRQVPKGRRNSGVREAGLVQDEYAGANHELADGWPKGILSSAIGPLSSWQAR